MKKNLRFLIFIFFVLPSTITSNGQQKVDSLLAILRTADDSSKIQVLSSLSWELRNSDPQQSIEYGLQAIELAKKYNDFKQLAEAISFVGVAYRVMGDYSQSISYYFEGLDIASQHGLKEQEGYAYLNIANLHIYQEHFNNAVENVSKAKAIAQETNNSDMLAYVYLYYGRALLLNSQIDSAVIYYEKSLKIRQEINLVSGQAVCLKYIGDAYFKKANYQKALENYNSSLTIIDKEVNKNLHSNLLVMLSKINLINNNYKEAFEQAQQGLAIAHEIDAGLPKRDASQVLADIYLSRNDYKTAAKYLHSVNCYNDTLFNRQLSEKIFFLQYQMDRQQKQTQINLLNKDNTIKELEINRSRTFIFALSSIVLLLGGFFVVALITLKVRREKNLLLEKQNKEIENQRLNIEQKNYWLNEANEKLAKSEGELKLMVQTKDKLFSIIAHDLKGPFTALLGLTQLLSSNSSEMDSNQIREYSELIHESSEKLLNLIENLLHWSRSQIGMIKLDPKNISIAKISNEVVNLLKTQASSKEVDLVNEVPDTILAFADFDTINTVIRNLVTNAIKFTEKDGVISLNAYRNNNTVVIKISDTGVGIREELLGKLFNLEESFSTKGTRQETGTGLGLIVCKEFVEKNGGQISVESQVGKGTIFTITLPAA
jgi:signal transduction histidine kinase